MTALSGPKADHSAKSASTRRWLAAAIILALGARFSFLAFFPWTLSLETSGYDPYAVHLLEGRGYTRFEDRSADSELPPLYPAFLAVVYALLGRGPIQVAVVQALLDGLVVALLFLIGRRVAGPAVGLAGAAMYALYPYLLFQNLSVNDTGVFILLLAAGVWFSYRTYDLGAWWSALMAGAAFGLAALTKPWALLIPPMLCLWWLTRMGVRKGLSIAAGCVLAALAVIAPWIIRNSLLHGEPTYLSTNDGSNLYQGNNPCVADFLRRGWDAQWVDCLETPPDGLNAAAQNRWYRRQALGYLQENPDVWLELAAVKLRALWNPTIVPTSLPPNSISEEDPVQLYHTPAFNAVRRLHRAYFGPLLLLAGVGFILSLRRGFDIAPLLSVIIAVTLTYLIYHPSTRYRAPADPFLFTFSALAAVEIWRWSRRHLLVLRT